MKDVDNNYEDIINLPHHVSKKRPHMSLHDRAAQFAPFAALTGYGDAISETARYTNSRKELTEAEKEILDQKLRILLDALELSPLVTVIYFEEDLLKEGGEYISETGTLKRINSDRRSLIFTDGSEIHVKDIISLECDLFGNFEF